MKSVCETAGDPSVNHLVVVDSGLTSGYRPRHSCFTDGRNGAPNPMDANSRIECEGASTWLDDDEVSNIAPGSALLYMVYSTTGQCTGVATDQATTPSCEEAWDVARRACPHEDGCTRGRGACPEGCTFTDAACISQGEHSAIFAAAIACLV